MEYELVSPGLIAGIVAMSPEESVALIVSVQLAISSTLPLFHAYRYLALQEQG
jgi:DNA polymerase III psi subunit